MENIDPIIYDSIDSVREKIEIVRKGSNTRKIIDVNKRIEQLKLMRAMWINFESSIHESSKKDLGQQEFLSYYSSYSAVLKELDHIIENVKEWSKPRPKDTPALFAPAKSYVIPEPFGVCLVMGSWNSPFNTLVMPVAEAIAAGNCVLAKPSEMSPYAAEVCQRIFQEMDHEIIQTIQGGVEVCIEVLKHKFDIIVFTGSPEKGRLVALAAAEHLTPCILELGGQNPVIIDDDVDIKNACYNIVNGRYLICGQICLAPEYVMVPRKLHQKIIDSLKETVYEFYKGNPKESADYSRVINKFHTERLIKLLNTHNGTLIVGGEYDEKDKYISPTIVSFDSFEKMKKSPLSASEIFGPILYVLPYDKIEECISYINTKDKPLVLYYFGGNKKNKEMIVRNTSSGAFVTNDTIVHFAHPELPFGGVGKSGYSACHGKYGFDNFSHLKPVLDRGQMLLKLRYPPFTDSKKKIMRTLLTKVNISQAGLVKISLIFTCLIFAIYFKSSHLWNYVNPFKNKIHN